MSSYRWLSLPLGTWVPAFVAAVLVLQACAPTRQESAGGAQPASAPAAPATASNVAAVPGLPADWEQQWSALVAAAQREGTVVVYGPPTPEVRARLPEAFKKRFGIDMEYNGLEGGAYSARLASERAAGVYAADAAINGSDSMYRILAAEGKITDGVMGMLVPLRPLLILPEVLDASKYRNGKLWFMDPQEQYILRIANYWNTPLLVNSQYVQPASLTSWQDLLKPDYRGKIVSYDPTIAGAAVGQAAYLYGLFGDDYVRQLYGTQAFLSRDHRQSADLLARGSHPISIALQSQESDRIMKEVPSIVMIPGLPDGPGYTAGGYGLVGVFDRAPHPNAARLFANWIASREGSQLLQDTNRELSTRNDVDVSTFRDSDAPKPGVDYLDSYGWDFVLQKRVKAQADLREILGRRGS